MVTRTDAEQQRRWPKHAEARFGLPSSISAKCPQACPFIPDPGRVAVAAPILIGLCRLARDVVAGQGVSIRREQHRHLGAGSGAEVVGGDQGNDLVTLVAQAIAGCGQPARQQERCTRKGFALVIATRTLSSERHRLDRTWVVVPDVADPNTHWQASHLLRRIGREQGVEA
jgi:hypothetical protein